jgi:hypothetical protein
VLEGGICVGGGSKGGSKVVGGLVPDVFISPTRWIQQRWRLKSPPVRFDRFGPIRAVEGGSRLVWPPNVGSIVTPLRKGEIDITSLIGLPLAAHFPSTISIFVNVHDFQFRWRL